MSFVLIFQDLKLFGVVRFSDHPVPVSVQVSATCFCLILPVPSGYVFDYDFYWRNRHFCCR